MPLLQSVQVLQDLVVEKTVVDMEAMREGLGGVSSMTVFRYLRNLDYRRSYNHNGRFYTIFKASRFDRYGLWRWGDVYFSVDGSLRDTVRRMVHESQAGMSHRDLQDRLQVRVQNTLGSLLASREVSREKSDSVFVYLHSDPAVRQGQMKRRTEAAKTEDRETEVSDATVIEVLLQLIYRPGSQAVDVARRLRRRSPPISLAEVESVFTRYHLGQKGGLSKS